MAYIKGCFLLVAIVTYYIMVPLMNLAIQSGTVAPLVQGF